MQEKEVNLALIGLRLRK